MTLNNSFTRQCARIPRITIGTKELDVAINGAASVLKVVAVAWMRYRRREETTTDRVMIFGYAPCDRKSRYGGMT